MAQRICDCGKPATNRKGPPRCDPCRAERVRLAQQRYRDKSRGSYLRGFDEPKCIWCGGDNSPRPYEVLSPKRFCRVECKIEFRQDQDRLRTRLTRRCGCGAEPTNKTGRPYCDPCRTAAKRRQARARNLRPYGMTIDDYDRLLESQNGHCAICPSTDPGHGFDVFAVDHDHTCCPGPTSCGKCIRGLLCRNHNSGIGLLGDDPDLLRVAADYIETARQRIAGTVAA